MQSPPPYPGQQKSPNKTLSTVLIVVSLSCIALCAFGGFMGLNKAREAAASIAPIMGCSMDMNAVGDGILAYAKEKGKLPSKETWQTDVLAYVKKEMKSIDTDAEEGMGKLGMEIKRMKLEGNWGCTVDATSINGYAFNSELSGKKLEDIVNRGNTALVFETDQQAAKNLSFVYKKLPMTAKPTVMGQPRDFMVYFADGQFDSDFGSGKSKAKVKITHTSTP